MMNGASRTMAGTTACIATGMIQLEVQLVELTKRVHLSLVPYPLSSVDLENLLLTPAAIICPCWMKSWIEPTTAPRIPAGTISDWYVLSWHQCQHHFSIGMMMPSLT